MGRVRISASQSPTEPSEASKTRSKNLILFIVKRNDEEILSHAFIANDEWGSCSKYASVNN